MKITTKLTALLLALVLALGVPLQVLAEETTPSYIETLTQYLENADEALEKEFLTVEAYLDYLDIAEKISDEDFLNFYNQLTDEQIEALGDHLIEVFWKNCVAYTQAGPLLPAININELYGTSSTFSLMSREATTTEEDEAAENGLILKKTATPVEGVENTYQVQLEVYVEGEVTTQTVSTPVDIVLVLDTSNSMTSNGFGTYDTRLEALIDAINGTDGFIDLTHSTYDEKTMDHRMCVISFNRTATVECGWTYVDDDGVSDLKAAVSSMNQDSNTKQNLGLDAAYTKLTDGSYTGDNEDRKQVVILFSDGEPADSRNEFDESLAISALASAKTIKDKGITLYSVALYSSDYVDPAITDIQWTVSTDDGAENRAKKANAFFNAVSSNYPSASATTTNGNFVITPGTGSNKGYYLTANADEGLDVIFENIFKQIQSGMATEQLDETSIVKDVITPYFELPYVTITDADGNETKDYSNAQITLTEYAHTGDNDDGTYQWTAQESTTATVNVTADNTLEITNFDFSENAVVTVTNDGSKDYKGSKLVITFLIETVDGFLGGNNVDTNESTSGVYRPKTDADGNLVYENGQLVYELFEAFEEPKVDVQVPDLEILAADQHIYLGNYADLDELLQSFSVTYNIVEKENGIITDRDGEYTVDTILNSYTDLTFYLKDSLADNANILATYTITAGEQDGTWEYNSNYWGTDQDGEAKYLKLLLTQDTPFYITYEATSKNDTTNNSSDDLTAWVYVYTPEVTFQDSVEQYMATMEEATQTAYYEGNNKLYTYSTTTSTDAEDNEVVTATSEGVVWRNATKGLSTENPMSGLEPKLTFTYTEVEDDEKEWLNSNKQVTATEDVEVTVTTTITGDTTLYGDQAKAKYIRNKVTTCPDGCKALDTYVDNTADDPAFVVHIIDVYGSLTITKTVTGDGASEDDTFLFTITGPGITGEMQVILKGGESVTINNLKIGDYTVTEDTSWSWRYICSTPSLTKAVASKTSTAFEFTNNLETKTWLDGNAHADNDFNQTTTEEGGTTDESAD